MAREYNLYLRNYVGGWDFDAGYTRYILDRNKDKEVTVLIDSTGGEVATALSISAAFKDHGKVHAHFTGMSASAATIASLGADHISMDVDAWYMIHKTSIAIFEWASLNADQIEQKCKELEKKKAELTRLDLQIAKAYARKCKRSPDDLYALMAKETWLTAQEALEMGFIDEITDYPDDPKPEISDNIAADLRAHGISLPEALRKKSPFSKLVSQISQLISPNMDKPQNQQPEDNNQSPKTEDQQPTTNDQKILDRLNEISRRQDNIEKMLKGDNPTDSAKQPTSSDQQPKTKDQQPATDDTTIQVVNSGSSGQQENSFVASMKSAADLYASLP